MQMLPVLGGAVIKKPVLVGFAVHGLLLFGLISLLMGLLWPSGFLMKFSALLLTTGFGVFIAAVVLALTGKKVANQTISAMYYAVLALLVTVVLGLLLILNLHSANPQFDMPMLTNIHLTWGLLGWIGLLVCGVAYQVVPMFQMTPQYPDLIKKMLAPLVFVGLLIWSGLSVLDTQSGEWLALTFTLVFVVAYSVFAILTLRLQMQRKRRVFDITRAFWVPGMLSLLVASALWLIRITTDYFDADSGFDFILAGVLIYGFAVSVINGMLYRIIPFIIWFHLQQRQIIFAPESNIAIPGVKSIIPVTQMKWQYGLYLASVILLPFSIFKPIWFTYPLAALIVISFGLLSYNLLGAVRLYHHSCLILDKKIAEIPALRENNPQS